MKLNPKLAKKPEDLETLPFKKVKQLLKKELERFTKQTSAEEPTDFILKGKHHFPDKPPTAGLPLFVVGEWKPPFRKYVKQTLLKTVDLKKLLVGQAYYAGEVDGQHIIRLLCWKGKGTASFFKPQFKKLLPQGYVIEYQLADDDGSVTTTEETGGLTNQGEDPYASLAFGDTHTLMTEQQGTTQDGKILTIPEGTEVMVIQKGERFGNSTYMTTVNGESVEFELPNTELMTHLSMMIAPVEVTAYSENAINRIADLKEEDWSNWFHDIGSDKIAYILRSFNQEEQKTFLEKGGLQHFAQYELNAAHYVTAIETWDTPLIDKLKLLEKENKNLSYEDCRALFVNADLTGFDLAEHYKLLPFKGKKRGVALVEFCKDAQLPETDRQWLEQNVLKGRSIDKVLTVPPLYDDLKDPTRSIKIDAAQVELLARVEQQGEGRASTTDKEAIVKWFQQNALTEVFALLDASEAQIKAILHNYAGEVYHDLEKEYTALMQSPYAGGMYTYRQALNQRANDQHSNHAMQQELRHSIERALGKKHPIIYTVKDFKELANIIEGGDRDQLQNHLEDILIEKLDNIQSTRDNLRDAPDKVWNLEKVITNTYINLAVQPKSAVGQIIVAHQDAYKRNETFISLALAALSIGLGILGAFATGGASLLITGAALTVGAYDFSRELSQYQLEEAAANTALQRAEALTQKQPELLWVAMAGLGVLGDAAAVAKVLKNVKIGKLAQVSDAERYADEVAAALAKEKGIPLDANNVDYQALRQLVKEKALAQLEEVALAKDAQKQLRKQQLADAWENLAEATRGRVLMAAGGIPPELIPKISKVFYYAIKNGAASLGDAMKSGGKKFDTFLEKHGISVTDPKQQQQLQDIFNKAAQAIQAEQQQIEAVFKAVDQLQGIPPNQIYAQQATIQKAWDDFLAETPIVRKLKIGGKDYTVELKFDANGNFDAKNMKLGDQVMNSKQKSQLYKALKLEHAAKNHSRHKDLRELAERTVEKLRNGTLQSDSGAQSGKFINDQAFVMGYYMARKKCFVKGKFDGKQLVKAGVVKASNFTGFYEYVIPIPKNYGVVYVNPNHSDIISIPSWVNKGSKPFPHDSMLQDIIEVPATEMVIVLDDTGDVKTMYCRAF